MASTYLQKTGITGSSETAWTLSCWVKYTKSSEASIYSAINGSNFSEAYFYTDNTLEWYSYSGGYVGRIRTNRVFRDRHAWYHLTFVWDSNNGTTADRMRLYVNGIRETSFSTETQPSSGASGYVNGTFNIGSFRDQTASYMFDGSMSHVHFIDGTAYDASTFGETDATTGIWKPKTAPSVTYGTNGFFLKFENSGAFGTDSSGNANNFTVNGTMTQTIDTPSNVFATGNPLNVPSSNPPIFTNGNLTWQSSGNTTSNFGGSSTIGVTQGKWYIEAKATLDETYSRNTIGISGEVSTLARNNITSSTNSTISYLSETGDKVVNDVGSSYGNSYTTGDIIGIALDLDNNYVYFSKNGTWQNSGVPTSGATGTGGIAVTSVSSTTDGAYFIYQADTSGAAATPSKFDFNFGNGYFGTTAVSSAENPDDGIGIFEYAVPTGYKALCTKSINAQEYD